ncbi:hypothetical protein [Lactococcus fujiensis]|uniref:Uncharacterized protein n=1 Tax=Lactococcus fujiensis JCM 16395 TaxID=1291764 RepID=A0A2A5RQ38_9LACT|nr:hypothetical protein [Lactococcus fujiensis]PCS01499.1 hypothetical protein RT41_GL000263 [Lactococcus fujiensis JCM 16395]
MKQSKEITPTKILENALYISIHNLLEIVNAETELNLDVIQIVLRLWFMYGMDKKVIATAIEYAMDDVMIGALIDWFYKEMLDFEHPLVLQEFAIENFNKILVEDHEFLSEWIKLRDEGKVYF